MPGHPDARRGLTVQVGKTRLKLYRDVELLFAEAEEPSLKVGSYRHERRKRRRVWVAVESAGDTEFPGLANAVMVRQETLHLDQGRRSDNVQSGVSSLAELEPERALSSLRGHLGIEKQRLRVKEDSSRGERQLLQCHCGGAVPSLLSSGAPALLRGRCEPWLSKEPLTGRAQRLCAQPHAILITP